jgi:aldose 1-epimerase
MTEVFGTLPNGEDVTRVTISDGRLTAHLISYGATLQDLRLAGVDHPLVLGTGTLEDYFVNLRFFGATVGRFANRIARGQFTIGGETYQTDLNEKDRTTLHGGTEGLGAVNWRVESSTDTAVTFAVEQADGHMGFPGALLARTTYRIVSGALEIEMSATCDKTCPISIANHSYFNLDGGADITSHMLHIAAEGYLPVDDKMIPTGDIAPVADTKFDFRTLRAVGEAGYDHNFCLTPAEGLREVAVLSGASGVTLRLETDAPGLQVYDAQHLTAEGQPGLEGRRYTTRAGLAMETQMWPDAPNQPGFPDAVVPAGETYRSLNRLTFTA